MRTRRSYLHWLTRAVAERVYDRCGKYNKSKSMWNARFFHIKKVYYNFRDRKQYIRLYRDSLKAGCVPIWTPPVLVGCPCVQSFPGGRSSIQELTTRSIVRSLKHKLNANHILGVILNDRFVHRPWTEELGYCSIFLSVRQKIFN